MGIAVREWEGMGIVNLKPLKLFPHIYVCFCCCYVVCNYEMSKLYGREWDRISFENLIGVVTGNGAICLSRSGKYYMDFVVNLYNMIFSSERIWKIG